MKLAVAAALCLALAGCAPGFLTSPAARTSACLGGEVVHCTARVLACHGDKGCMASAGLECFAEALSRIGRCRYAGRVETEDIFTPVGGGAPHPEYAAVELRICLEIARCQTAAVCAEDARTCFHRAITATE